MTPRHHPDSYKLDDWGLYGPTNPEICRHVDRFALDDGLRVRQIEDLILQALKDRLALEEARPTS
ncbi:hypothetical protein PANO111632_16620 [Paracoccus nototheniae]|uniref:Uncharacterized protein n=1 Tax=Paracoccus nototheniae TaxID=2489002 RepID=A0ABW4DZP2_9RHOB|nr:hypothetical protein [Paracoccus nototheniae]